MSVRIAVIADVHLPDTPETVQTAALEWALGCLRQEQPDLVVVAGDLTATGTVASARRFREALEGSGLRFAITPGNAELRTPSETPDVLRLLATDWLIRGDGWSVVLLDSSSGCVPESERSKLTDVLADVASGTPLMVVTHIPLNRLPAADRAWFASVLADERHACLVAGHTHRDEAGTVGAAAYHVVRGLDPDKAIGGPPCLSLLDFDAGAWRGRDVAFPGGSTTDWDAAQRQELARHLGYSCMADPMGGISEGAARGVPVLELRADTLAGLSAPEFRNALSTWRECGGKHLSLHMGNLRWDASAKQVTGAEQFSEDVRRACALQCQSLTVHVPRAAVRDMVEGGEAWSRFTEVLTHALQPALEQGMTIGIENMHKARGEPADERRGFGYTPDECLRWVRHLRDATGYATLGMHLDIGHARNNGMFASHFPLGTWYALVGSEITGLHVHQVRARDGRAQNHVPFEGLYGPMISLASFLWAWRTQQIRHAPVILEIREPGNGWNTMDRLVTDLDLSGRR